MDLTGREKTREEAYKATDSQRHGKSKKDRYKQDESGQWWYHTKQCRERAIVSTCVVCGDTYPDRKLAPAKTCSRRECRRKLIKDAWKDPELRRKRAGPNSRHWKGGIQKTKRGYVYVFMPEHPSLVGTTRKTVRRCRLVMEQHLGRPLESWEQVHHKNNVKDDDRIENLELWIISHPAGTNEYYCPHCTCEGCKAQRSK